MNDLMDEEKWVNTENCPNEWMNELLNRQIFEIIAR